MNILGWHIDGFGHFHDWRHDGVASGATIVHGPNEAGKSTLLAFLQRILFGFPAGNATTIQKYLPLKGGQHGGRVFLADAKGQRWTVERHAGQRKGVSLRGPDDQPGGEEELADLLGHADGRLFQSVFAFSLDELRSFDTLNAEGVREQLFSAGIAGAGRSATVAQKAILKDADVILAPRKGTLRDLQKEIAASERQLVAAREEARHHDAFLETERVETAKAAAARSTRQAADRARARADLLIRLWPVQLEINDRHQELATLGTIDPELADLDQDLKDLATRREQTAELVARAGTALEDMDKRLGALAPDAALAAIHTEARAVTAEATLHRDRLERLADGRTRSQQMHDEIARRIADLGPDWTVDRVATLDLSVPGLDTLWNSAASLEEARKETADKQRRRDDAATALEDARRGQQAVVAEAGPDCDPETPPFDHAELEARGAHLRALRSALPERLEHRRNIDYYNDRVRSVQTALAGLPPPAGRMARIALPAGSALLVVLALAAAGTGVYFEDQLWWLVAAVAVAPAITLAALHPARQRRLAAGDAQRAAHQQQVEAETRNRDAAGRASRETEARISRAVIGLGLAPAPDGPETEVLDRIEAALEADRTALRTWTAACERIREAARRTEQATQRLDQAQETLDATIQAGKRAEAAWSEALAKRGLPTDLSPDGTREFIRQVSGIGDRLADVDTLDKENASLAETVESWRARVRDCLDALEDPRAPEEAIDDLANRLEKDAADRQKAEAAQTQRDKAAHELHQAKASLDRIELRLVELREKAGAVDDQSLFARVEAAMRHRTLTREIAERQRLLDEQIGADPDAQSLRADLREGAVETWQARRDEAERESAAAQEEEDAAAKQAAAARARREEIEASANVPEIEGTLEALRAEYERLLDQWRTQRLAAGLIGDTLAEFQRSRQPAVLEQAGRWFRAVTGGRYTSILQNVDGDVEKADLRILTHRDTEVSPSALSRGTAEQLYLCLRLGLAASFGERRVALPVIVDDVFVNFDPGRAREMARTFLAFAATHQTLVFTCHPWIRDLFQELDGGIPVLELPPADEPVH